MDFVIYKWIIIDNRIENKQLLQIKRIIYLKSLCFPLLFSVVLKYFLLASSCCVCYTDSSETMVN